MYPGHMAARPITLLLLLSCALAASSAGATQFRVGGQSGWSVPAAGAEPYNTWAGRLRFQIGDQLLFVYPKETDSVLQVDAAAYNACNTSSYVARFDDGSTVFTFDRSGPFFFVSGNEASCRANEKLIVVVLADRSGTRTPPAAPPPTTTSPPPAPSPAPRPSPPSPPAGAPAPATSPSSSSPPSSGAVPVPAPAATPTSPPPSPPASAPAPAPTTAPSSPPAPAGAQTPAPSTTPTPGGGSSSPPPASASAPAGEGGSSSTTPPPPSAAAHVVAGFVGSLGAFIGYAMLAA